MIATHVFPKLHTIVARTSLPRPPRYPDHGTHCAARWPSQRRLCAAQAVRQEGPPPRGGGTPPDSPSPQEALFAALQESGVPLEQIQVGRAPGDSEVWTDLLDAETDDVWMRDPPMPEYIEELLGGDLTGGNSTPANHQVDQQPPGDSS